MFIKEMLNRRGLCTDVIEIRHVHIQHHDNCLKEALDPIYNERILE